MPRPHDSLDVVQAKKRLYSERVVKLAKKARFYTKKLWMAEDQLEYYKKREQDLIDKLLP